MPITARSSRANFTKENIREVMDLWESKTTDQIAEKLGVNRNSITYIANIIRKEGVRLPKKHRVGYIRGLIKEVIAERETRR